MSGDFDITSGDTRIKVTGLSQTLRAMSKAGADAEDMRDLMQTLGMLVVTAARPSVPMLSGSLQTTLRPGKGKTKAVVRAGGARTPYAGVIHYGWPKRNIAPSPFLTDALQSARSEVFAGLDQGLNELLQKNNLK